MYVRNMMAQRVLARSFPPLLKCCVGESVSPGVFQSDFPIPTFHSADLKSNGTNSSYLIVLYPHHILEHT